MSKYLARLTSRDGFVWPPTGQWQDVEGINILETFAVNLDLSHSAETDLLNSVPTPWARLLLFETALLDTNHPAHKEVKNQWRGLLGVLALYNVLGLRLKVRRFDLGNQQGIAQDAFTALRPFHMVNDQDVEAGKWHGFDMIYVDDFLLGATSPRTLVFTGAACSCPSSVPFRSENGMLTDPAVYYKKFNDRVLLGLLAHWLDTVIRHGRDHQGLIDLLGVFPAPPDEPQIRRHDKLMNHLIQWRSELETPALQYPIAPEPVLQGAYAVLKPVTMSPVPAPEHWNKSDLLLKNHTDVIVCFRPEQGSFLIDAQRQPITDAKLKIYDGHWTEASRLLPATLGFLPPEVRVIENPSDFFEEILIPVTVNPETTYSLHCDQAHFLLPFTPRLLAFLKPEDIVKHTTIHQISSDLLRIELAIPLVKNRFISISKTYRDDQILKDRVNE